MDEHAPGQLSSKDWIDATPLAALARAYDLADANAARAIDWYRAKMRWRGRSARWIRLSALLLFGVGGLVPIAKPFVGPLLPGLEWQDLGYVALALGAAFLGFDYFFGISSAYTRFVTTELGLEHARARFQADWLALVARSGPLEGGASLAPFLDRLQQFVVTVVGLVDRETQEWVAEFRSSLAELEKIGNRLPGRGGEPPQPAPPPATQPATPQPTTPQPPAPGAAPPDAQSGLTPVRRTAG